VYSQHDLEHSGTPHTISESAIRRPNTSFVYVQANLPHSPSGGSQPDSEKSGITFDFSGHRRSVGKILVPVNVRPIDRIASSDVSC
jgi:hypothetical protein